MAPYYIGVLLAKIRWNKHLILYIHNKAFCEYYYNICDIICNNLPVEIYGVNIVTLYAIMVCLNWLE
jgi:hypothetical protein